VSRVTSVRNAPPPAISQAAAAAAASAATIAAAIHAARPLLPLCDVSSGPRLNGERLWPATGLDFGFPLRRTLAIDALPPSHAGA
jgi:hypothetical protein